MKGKQYSLAEIGAHIEAKVDGDPELVVSGLSTLQSAGSHEVSFLANAKYAKYLGETAAGAVILTEEAVSEYSGNKLVHSNPYLAYAKLSLLWDRDALSGLSQGESKIHPSASVSESANIGQNVVIGPGVVIGDNVEIADQVAIGANSVVDDDCVIGSKTRLAANVTLYHDVSIGANCIVHSGVVIGSDGFGFAPTSEGWHKIAQLGGVRIGSKVEIGANTTIDRGALDDTIIENGVILDNQIQIAHNVVVGENSAIAACSAIAGSTTLGKNVIVGGASGIAGHLSIADNVHITAMTMVIKSLPKAGVYSSGTGVQPNDKWRRSIARLRQLDKLANRVSELEKKLKDKGDIEGE